MKINDYDGINTFLSASNVSGDILTIDDTKTFARIDDTALSGFDLQNDTIISGLITASIDKFEEYTGRNILQKSYVNKYTLYSGFSTACITLPNVDITINSVAFYDADDVKVPVLSTDYNLDAARGVLDIYQDSIVTNLRRFNNFEIEYDSGIFDTTDEVKDDIKTALKQNISHWYENRQSVSEVSTSEVVDTSKSTFYRYKARKV